jgi:predicted dehydrogenase
MAPSSSTPESLQDRIRVAVVGLGFGSVHVAAYRRDSRCEVVALCGRQRERAVEVANHLGVPRALVDWRELLDPAENVDVISLAVPAPVQVTIGRAALEAGKHVFFEKPLADSVESAEALASLAAAHRRATAVNFEFPETAAWKEAKRLLNEGRIGALRHVAATWRVETYANRERLDTWKARSAEGGGALNLFASHCLYYLEWLLGPMRSISAKLDRAAGDERQGDTLDAMVLTAESGVTTVLSIATDAFLGPGHRLELYGDAGTLVLENRGSDYISGFRLLLAERQERDYRAVPVPEVEESRTEDGRVDATAAIVRRLVDAIALRKEDPTPGVREGVRVQRLMDAARLSSSAGRVVPVGLGTGSEKDR